MNFLECKGPSGGTLLLNEHSFVVNVVDATEFASLAIFDTCTLLGLGSIRLFGFSGACSKNVHGQRPIVWL